MEIMFILFFAMGAIVGFAWGLDCALKRPSYARGFLKGFYFPLTYITDWMKK